VNAWLQKIVGSGNRDTAIRPTLLDLESIPCAGPVYRRPFSAITHDGLELHPAVEEIYFAAAELRPECPAGRLELAELLLDGREPFADRAEIHFNSGEIHADEPELRADRPEHHFDVLEMRADGAEISADRPAQASVCAEIRNDSLEMTGDIEEMAADSAEMHPDSEETAGECPATDDDGPEMPGATLGASSKCGEPHCEPVSFCKTNNEIIIAC
jgi:hypothetical protein